MKKISLISLMAGVMLAVSASGVLAAKSTGYDAVVDGDYRAAVNMLVADVAKGDNAALFNLALMYHGGYGVQQDEAAAVRMYHQAAEAGYPWAQEFLAVGYQEGWFGLKKSKKQAKYWNKKIKKNQYY